MKKAGYLLAHQHQQARSDAHDRGLGKLPLRIRGDQRADPPRAPAVDGPQQIDLAPVRDVRDGVQQGAVGKLGGGADRVRAGKRLRLDAPSDLPRPPAVPRPVDVRAVAPADPRIAGVLVPPERARCVGRPRGPAPSPLEQQHLAGAPQREARALDAVPVEPGRHGRGRPRPTLIGRARQHVVEPRIRRTVQDLRPTDALHERDQPLPSRQPHDARMRTVREWVAVDGRRAPEYRGHPGYPLIPAPVTPSIKCRCSSRNATRVGMASTVMAAMTVSYALMSVGPPPMPPGLKISMPTGSVFMLS